MNEKQNVGSARRVTCQAGASFSPSSGQSFSTLTLWLAQPGQLETIRACAKAVVSLRSLQVGEIAPSALFCPEKSGYQHCIYDYT